MTRTNGIPNVSPDLADTRVVATQILEQLARYRLLTLSAIDRLVTQAAGSSSTEKRLRDSSRPNWKLVLTQLIEQGVVGDDTLYHRKTYFHLTPRAKQLVGANLAELPEHWFGPLPERAKVVNFAMLAFCVLGERPRCRLTRKDLRQHFAGLDRPGLPLNYYVDLGVTPPRLGFIRVDAGGHGRWDRVLAKAHIDWRRHAGLPAFRPFVAQGQFEVAIVTALPQKAERLREAIADSNQRMVISASAVPELVHLLMSK